jgi:Zn-dependent alcohol dehydrogenase
VSTNGRVVLVGVPKKGSSASLYTLPLHFGKSVVGSTGGESVPHVDIPRYMKFAKARDIELSDLITEVAPLQKIDELLTNMRSGVSAGRCLVDFSL